MNKTDLIGALADRMDGDRRTAQVAVENVIDLIQRAVHGGDTVSISGFGVFEKRARAARTARNPRTGQAVKVKKTTVPAFRPGKYFKDVIAGTVKLPKSTGGAMTARAAAAAAKASSTKTGSKAPSRAGGTKESSAKSAPGAESAPKATRSSSAKTAAAPKAAGTRTRAAKAPAEPKESAGKAGAAPKSQTAKAPARKAAVKK